MVEIREGLCNILMGLVVDSVSEVLNIKSGELEDTPAFGVQMDTDYIMSMAKTGEGVKILLDIDKVFGGEEMLGLAQAA